MAGIFWRILIAVFAVVITFALIPPVARVIGFTLSNDVMIIVRICVGAIALFYILRGSNPPWSKA